MAHYLKRAGYRVHIQSNANWEALVRAAGADFVPIAPPDPPQSGRDDKRFFLDVTLPSFRTSFDHIESLVLQGRRPLILFRNNMVGAACAAERFGLVAGSVCLQPSAIPSRARPPWPLTRLGASAFGRRAIMPTMFALADLIGPYRKASNQFRRSIGLAPDGRNWRGTAGDFTLLLCPRWFALPQADWPDNCFVTGFPLAERAEPDPVLAAFIERWGAPLVVTPGTGVDEPDRFVGPALGTARRLDMPLVLLSPHARPRPGLERVAIRRYADLGWLLPRARALVHHGGIGTCAEAIRAGIPQLVIPDRFDQPDNAMRVAILGLGGAVLARGATEEVWVRAMRELLGSRHVATQLATARHLVASQNGARNAAMIADAFACRAPPSSDLAALRAQECADQSA